MVASPVTTKVQQMERGDQGLPRRLDMDLGLDLLITLMRWYLKPAGPYNASLARCVAFFSCG